MPYRWALGSTVIAVVVRSTPASQNVGRWPKMYADDVAGHLEEPVVDPRRHRSGSPQQLVVALLRRLAPIPAQTTRLTTSATPTGGPGDE